MLEVHDKINVTVAKDTDHPYLQGFFAPMDTEYTATTDTMQVIGEIPKDLHGIYIRNTHNQVHEPLGIYHPFDGDGMLHAIHFENGKAEYRNRFVQTIGYLAEKAAGKSLWPGMLEPHLATARGWGSIGKMKDNAGTDVIAHSGKLLATMSQGSEPWRLDPLTLETLGVDAEINQKILPRGIASHYKVDVHTGELMFFNYGEQHPYLNYGVLDRNGNLAHYVPVELPGPRWPHDLGITKNYTILHDLPFILDEDLLKKDIRRVRFYNDRPARFGVIPRHGDNSQIKWFEAKPCFILHLANCYEEGDWVIQDGCIQLTTPGKPPIGVQGNDAYEKIKSNLNKHKAKTQMYRWKFNMRTGQTVEELIDDEVTEFPVVSNENMGYDYRFSYNTLFHKDDWLKVGLKRYDMKNGDTMRYEYGDQRYGSEPVVAKRVGAVEEDDGYVLTFITDMIENRSECLILDAKDISAGPLARVILPARISNGIHSTWVEGDRIHAERN
ncbi:carotenoid oxygenase family protein [Sporosarcina sp. GW1-11]|uniref:carotenoid oxygenase family protein n=1 Tax=Sporosarcina sp. GW1-11 TaxID=2899126 RepID=UPI00294DE036|nr:carotenoid oxygenase family protein [Sporosarcina sp. GW1-11]MDV6377461.1 carotenoid oxygenase family protein [Sporosarcina sp. GW1-11]